MRQLSAVKSRSLQAGLLSNMSLRVRRRIRHVPSSAHCCLMQIVRLVANPKVVHDFAALFRGGKEDARHTVLASWPPVADMCL